jgi:hypothetical protein
MCRRHGGIVINERRDPSLTHGRLRLVRPRREPDTYSGRLHTPKKDPTEWASPDAEDDFVLEAIMARPLNDVPPMLLDQALAW